MEQFVPELAQLACLTSCSGKQVTCNIHVHEKYVGFLQSTLQDRIIFLTYQRIQDRLISMFTCQWQNRSHIAAHVRQALLYSRQPTCNIWCHNVPNDRITSGFPCLRRWLLQRWFKISKSTAPLFVNENIKCGFMHFLRTKGAFWYPNCLTLLKFLFHSFTSDSSMFQTERKGYS